LPRLSIAHNSTVRPVPLQNPTADFNQDGWTIAMALDAKGETAWGIHPAEGKRHVAVFEPQVRIAEGWLAAAEGNVSAAIDLALDAARLAKESGQQAIEMLALHDAVRFGDQMCLDRLIEVARARDMLAWRIGLDRLREQLPLTQRYPSHLQRVLQPAHDMLKQSGVIREAVVRQQQREWFVDYVLAGKSGA